MISEPELTGGAPEEPAHPARPARPAPDGPPAPSAVPGPRAAHPAPFRDRRLWSWGIGGIALASLAWAAGLHAYEARHSGRPDVSAYVLGDGDPCGGPALAPLTEALGVTETRPVSPSAAHRGPALDQARCAVSATARVPKGGSADYEISVTVDLHKRTDPRTEFADQRALSAGDLTAAESTRVVRGLGDEAYLLTVSAQKQELKVRDGGAVFTLTLTGYTTFTVSDDTVIALHGADLPSSDLRGFQPQLIAAMRGLMAAEHRPR